MGAWRCDDAHSGRNLLERLDPAARFRWARWLGFWLAATTLGCGNATEPLRVGTNVWPGYEPLHLAQKLGEFRAQPIELISFPSAAEVMRAYRYGRLDVAATTIDEALTLSETVPDQSIILVCDFSNGADALLAHPEFNAMQELKRRRIGYEPNALGAYVLARALEVAGMQLSDVVAVPVQLEGHERAYSDNTVDAVITFEPRRTHLLAQGAHQLFDSTRIPGEIVDVLLTRKPLIQARRSALQALITGWFTALDYLRQHPRDAAQHVAARERLSPEGFLAALAGLELPNRESNLRLLGASTQSLSGTLHRLSTVMVQNKLLAHEIDTSRLLEDGFVRAAVP